jgi:hypothetical protein
MTAAQSKPEILIRIFSDSVRVILSGKRKGNPIARRRAIRNAAQESGPGVFNRRAAHLLEESRGRCYRSLSVRG